MIIVHSSVEKSFLIFLHVREELPNQIFEQFRLGRPAFVFLYEIL